MCYLALSEHVYAWLYMEDGVLEAEDWIAEACSVIWHLGSFSQ